MKEEGIIMVMSRPPADGNFGSADQPPEKGAHETEHMMQRKHAHKAVLRRQRQHGASVPGTCAERTIGQGDRFALSGGPGGEKEHPSVSGSFDPGGQVRCHRAHQFRIAPENVNVGGCDLFLQKFIGGCLIQKNCLHSGQYSGKDREDAVHASVAQDSEAGTVGILPV